MGNKLYVGNLPYTFRDEDLQQAFAAHGTVTSAKVMMERDTGRYGDRAGSRQVLRPSIGCRARLRPALGDAHSALLQLAAWPH